MAQRSAPEHTGTGETESNKAALGLHFYIMLSYQEEDDKLDTIRL